MRRTAEFTSGFSGAVAIFPVVGHARVAEDERDQIGEAGFGANIVRQDHDTTLTASRCRPWCWRSGRRGRLCRTRGPAGQSKTTTPRPAYKSLRCSLTGRSGRKGGNWWAVAICSCGFVISAREVALRPSPRTRAAANSAGRKWWYPSSPPTRTLLRFHVSCGWP